MIAVWEKISVECPICKRLLSPPEQSESGIERWYCDCAGFRRAVVEIIPADKAETNVNVKEKGRKDDRSN